MPILLRKLDQKSIETVFLIAICRPTGDKRQSKILFLSIFVQYSLIVDHVFDCCISGLVLVCVLYLGEQLFTEEYILCSF